MKYNSTWTESPNILPKHENLSITQVYCWILTHDHKYIIVSKDGEKWQLPGGHPNTQEKPKDALIREVWEETNVELEQVKERLQFFGYNFVQEFNDDGQHTADYLQLRYFIRLDNSSKDLVLKANESPEDTATAHILFVEAVDQAVLEKRIPWLPQSGEYTAIKAIISREAGF